MSRSQQHILDVDVEQRRPTDTPHFPTSCSCGTWLRTHLSRAEAIQAWYLHLRDPEAFPQRQPREERVQVEDFVSGDGSVGGNPTGRQRTRRRDRDG